MSENSPSKTPRIKDWLASADSALKNGGITTSRLDSELILSKILKRDRTFFHAHPDTLLSNSDRQQADSMINKRLDYVPIAYLIGTKDFYGREFIVNPNVLIPRPESEEIISSVLDIINNNYRTPINIIDVGTGSGCLGITIKLEAPQTNVTLSDISESALSVAKDNANNLGADVDFVVNDLLFGFSNSFDLIVANLPYVSKNWPSSPSIKHEPDLALFANNDGLELINILLNQSQKALKASGFIVLEADPCQHPAIIEYAKNLNLQFIQQIDYVVCFRQQPDSH